MAHIQVFDVPPEIEAAIQGFDRSTGPLDLFAVEQKVIEARQLLGKPASDEANHACWSEVLAFALAADLPNSNPWGTYFGPVATLRDDKGNLHYRPDIVGTEPRTLDQWKWRATTLIHPILRARYADLVWDLGPTISNQKPEHEFANLAVDSYLDSVAKALHEDDYDRFRASERALSISESLRDEARIDTSRAALLSVHRSVMVANLPLWWRAPDRLLNDKYSRTTDVEKEELVRDLEKILATKANRGDPKAFDPHQTEDAAKRLIAFYEKAGMREEVVRLRKLIGESFEFAASIAGAMVASSFLQTAVNAFKQAGSREDAARARIAMESAIDRSRDEMQTHTFEHTISREDMEGFLSSVVLDNPGKTMIRLASEFLSKRTVIDTRVAESAKEAPLSAAINQTIMADNRVTAVIGSVEEDPEGRAIAYNAQEMALSEVFLVAALGRAVEVHGLSPDYIVGWAARSHLFEDLTLLYEGVAAWFDDDYIKALHVLVPQIEHGLRSIVASCGLATTKAHRVVPGASVAIGMGDILGNKEALEILGDDLALHFLTLYSDPRGVNLRNELAHGLLPSSSFAYGLTCRVIHTLLVLGIWSQLTAARRGTPVPREPDSAG